MAIQILPLSSSAVGIQGSQVMAIEWPSLMQGDGVKLHRVKGEESPYFTSICSWYEKKPEELTEELNSAVLWCICDETDQPLGTIFIEADLDEQVTDKAEADKLFNQGKTLELSYAVIESLWNKGWGSKALKAWMEEANRHPYGKGLFAVVDEMNQPSIRILEKSGFQYHGHYFHPSEPEVKRLIYIS